MSKFKVGQLVVTPDGEKCVITRIDNHIFPICAGYKRWKPEQLKLITMEDFREFN